jgi:hypothetical protein
MRALQNCARCHPPLLRPRHQHRLPVTAVARASLIEGRGVSATYFRSHAGNARCARERHGQGQIFQRDQRLRDLRRRAEEDRRIRDRWRAESRQAITALAQKLDQHAAVMEKMQPAVAALELSRSKLAAWASIGFAGFVVLGWVVEATVKWAVERAWSYLH